MNKDEIWVLSYIRNGKVLPVKKLYPAKISYFCGVILTHTSEIRDLCLTKYSREILIRKST